MFRESLVMVDDHHTGVSSKCCFSGLPSLYLAAPNDKASFRWNESDLSCKETGSVLDNSVVLQDVQKMEESNSAGSGANLMSKMESSGHPSPGNDWSQALIQCKGGAVSSMQAMLQEDSSSASNFQQETRKNCSAEIFVGSRGNASLYMFNQIDQAINSDRPCLNSGVTCQDFPANKLSMISTNFGSSPLALLRGSFDSNSQPQEAIYNDQSINYMNSNDIPPQCLKFPQLLNSNTPRQQPTNQLHFSNNTPFWKASAAAMSNVQSSLYPFPQTQLLADNLEEKPNCCNLTGKIVEEIHDSSLSMKKSNNELGLKRPRIEMPLPLPTFKVRKEKLGDRITVLQQLVSPFGKTDTASVLFEAIKCIKFLHEQVNVLSIPYMKNGTFMQQKNYDKSEDVEGPKRDLRSSGLCLVPISITFAVANEIAADIWTPSYGEHTS